MIKILFSPIDESLCKFSLWQTGRLDEGRGKRKKGKAGLKKVMRKEMDDHSI